jgi:hypothetical protein
MGMRWTEAVLSTLSNVVTWPVRSLSLDGLMAAFKAREARDACGLTYTLEVARPAGGAAGPGAVAAVTVAAGAGAGCDAPLITLPGGSLGGASLDATDATAPAYKAAVAGGQSVRLAAGGIPWSIPS